MLNFKKVKEGNTNVIGLNSELESVYINYVYNMNTSNVLVVANSIYEANKIYNSIINYNKNVNLFLMDDFIASVSSIMSPELEINRLETLNSIVFDNTKKIIITNLAGLLRFLPQKDVWQNSKIFLEINKEKNKEELFSKLVGMGYKRENLVTKTGEISSRGYILDIFPINEDNAIRIEFFGDTIDSIRYFDVNTQLSIKEINSIYLYSFSEFIVNVDVEDDNRKQEYLYKYGKISKLTDYLDNPIIIYKDYSQIYNAYLLLEEELANYNKSEKYMHNLGEFCEKTQIYISSVDNLLPNVDIDETHIYNSHNAPRFNDNIEELNNELNNYINLKKTVIICLNTEHQIKSVSNFIKVKHCITKISNIKEEFINLVLYPIVDGYVIDDVIVLGAVNLFKNIEDRSIYKSKFKFGTKISNVNSLNIGDYVVHNMHGIGQYLGIIALKQGNIVKDYLQIKYRDDGKLYIPVEKIELISKYSSNESIEPRLNKLGGTEWQKTKARVKVRLREIADSLLKIAVERKMKEGFAFKKDSPMQIMFEQEFPYNETSDQIRATNQIKEAMEDKSPMDILLCGDVGYGKTEVAFRAMFKAICSNKQVAYLCPTTILSNQQYNNALVRFQSFPVNIGLLNRFTNRKEVAETLKKLEEGKIDILFGTHRILSDDVKFKDLGLLVVDEEQRFGVAHKEKIKEYKSNIDVLTLSATPIPRTLQMSMVGIRNLILIETPPNNRYPVQTYVLEENDYVIKDAIYKELSRNGQVYMLCNRINLFEEKIRNLTKLIPGIKIGYAHGKMNKNEMEDIMLKFINKEFNVLLCTTIIETGIDIPNVNTLIILDADKFGLSQLYQIRGRVGRTNKVAYAYLMYPHHKVLSEIATKRLVAIKEFAQLGSGYSIALRDLSIRGAGDVLGVEQSGFIDSIGIELYLRLLNEEVDKLKGIVIKENADTPPSLSVETHIDDSYVNSDELKIEIHKMINTINSMESLEKVKKQIEDRFGKISENMLIYMYEEWFENLKDTKGIEYVKQTERFIELVFDPDITKELKADQLFVKAYRISKNFKLSYSNKRLILTLNILNLEKHWIYYIVELLNNL